jgi:GT2 family glycosyltransferase
LNPSLAAKLPDTAAEEPPPAVTVIVLGYEGRDYVRPCLASVLDQDFDRPYEVLFVDNASRDDSADLASTFAGVRVHRLDRNYGYTGGNNRGATLARAPLLLFLNQDTVVHRAWLRELVSALESDPAVKAAHASLVHPWNGEFAAKERREPPRVAYGADLSRLGFVEYRSAPASEPVLDTLFLSGVSILLDRSVIPEIGGYVFDPDMFLYGEDMDLALRIRSAGYRTVLATRAVVYHDHRLDDSLSFRSFLKTVRIIRNRLLALWKSSDWLEFFPLAALTLLGSPLNAGQFGLPPAKRLLNGLLLVPPTIAALLAAPFAMPRYAARRRDLLARRRLRRGWLLRALLLHRPRLRPLAAGA